MTIRPVTRKLPDSKELWDDTNLPMCVVVTPGAGAEKPTVPAALTPGLSLAHLPKCLHCGAPHATRQTHFRPLQDPVLVCYLCGKTSSTLWDDQQDARELEVLDSGTYDRFAPQADGEVIVDLPLFSASVAAGTDISFAIPKLVSKACPPVWWIVLDASQSARSYWTTIGSTLERMMQEEDIPEHVHVGILSAGSTHLSSWDLTSDLPHVCHYPYSAPNIPLCLVPADALYKSNIQTAIRAIADSQPGTLSSSSSGDTEDGLGMALGLALEVILEFMDGATHPGDEADSEDAGAGSGSGSPAAVLNGNPQDQQHDADVTLRYAGGKILCLLGNPPLEIASKLLESQPSYGAGGVAGSCSNPTENKWDVDHNTTKKVDDKPEQEPTDWTPSNLKEYVEPLDPEDLFESIGTKCASAALGVDLIVVVPKEVEPNQKDTGSNGGIGAGDEYDDLKIRPFYGLPLLNILAYSSGAPGPVMFGTKEEDSIKALEQQLMARTPWQPGMIFGVHMRSRITPGFDLEDSPIDPVGRDKLQLAPFLSSGGLAGPAVMADKGLWFMGSCDPHTSVIVDYQVATPTPNMVVTADGLGQIALKPVLQICVAYTCVEHDDESGEYYTVRKLKISSLPLPLESDSEPLYDALDPEALAVVLFQKLVLNAVQDGFVAAQETAEIWLKSLLVCVYQSAQVEQAKIEELLEQSGGNRRLLGAAERGEGSPTWVANERLLDIDGGDLSDEDILLGRGHIKIEVMPLIVYSLMQCDALRPTMGSFAPSMDARCAALTQMTSMTPSCLSKCIAPTLQLWSTLKDELLMESIDLNQSAIQQALKECQQQAAAADAVFFLDSPQQILVYRADQQGLFASSSSSTAASKAPVLRLGPRLKAAIQVAAQAYRTPPPTRVELKAKPFSKAAAMRFQNALVEDCPTFGGTQDYADWRLEMAHQIHEELKKTGDIIS